MENLNECPACSSKSFKFIQKCKDFLVSFEEFNIVECHHCQLLFTNPRPDIHEISKYYDSSDYISHSNSSSGLFNRAYQNIRNYSIGKKIKLIEGLNESRPKKLLDIGCGTGEFLAACKTAGWECNGVEPNEAVRKKVIEKYAINAYPESVLEDKALSISEFSIITMWHVLEHVHELRKRLEQTYQLLSAGGHLIIAVPNPASEDAHHYGDLWAAYDVPRHLYHFKPEVLKKLVQGFGFRFIQSRPMPFDSFYVSLLSEKHIQASLSTFKALFNGLKSNLKAGKTAEKYSSVIYVFRKD